MKNNLNIQFVKTRSIIFDDRLRKISTSISKSGNQVEIFILADSNSIDDGRLSDSIKWSQFRLLSRTVFPSKKFLWLKVIEYSLRNLFIVVSRNPSSVWVHDLDGLLSVILIGLLFRCTFSGKKLIFDMHELPHASFFNNFVLRNALRLAIHLADSCVTANCYRWEYTVKTLNLRAAIHHFTLKNYPSIELLKEKRGEIPKELATWLSGSDYLVFLGRASQDRLFEEVLSSVIRKTQLKLVVVGPIEPGTLNSANSKWGDLFESRVYVTGWVPQEVIFRYVDHALGSIVLYRNCNLNNWFCAPNRFYYSIARGVPVLCGNNPEMNEIAKNSNAVLALETDGSDQMILERGLVQLIDQIDAYRQGVNRIKKKYYWEFQDCRILDAVRLKGA